MYRTARHLHLHLFPGTLALLLALAAMWWSAAAPASANGLEVLADRSLVDFPQRIVFALSASTDAEIVEVRLNYRTSGSNVWSYSYPDFQPGNQVDTTFTMTTDGASYLPPGVLLEYYYTLRDAEGNMYRTPRGQVEYFDTRFDWQETAIGPLSLLHYNQRESSVDAVAQDVAEDLRHIAALLEVELDQPVKGIVYNQAEAARSAFPNQSRTTTEQGVFQGYAFPEHGVFVVRGLDPRIIVHESSHLLLHQALSPTSQPIPSWLDEGLASYMEPGAAPYSGQTLSGQGLPLRAMATVSGDPHAIRTFYLKAESVVAYLIEGHGRDAFQEFINRLASNEETVDDSLRAVYGFDVDGLDDRWARSDHGQGNPPGNGGSSLPSPLVYLDTWLLGGLVLLAVVVVVGRFLWRRLHDDSDPEEGLQPWEDPDRQ